MEKEPQNLKDIFEAGILTGQFMRNYTNRNIKAKRFKIMDHPWTFLRKWSSYWSFIHKEFSYVRWTWEGFFALVNVQMNNVIFSAAYNFLIYIWVASEFDVHSSYSSRWAGPLIHGHKFFFLTVIELSSDDNTLHGASMICYLGKLRRVTHFFPYS